MSEPGREDARAVGEEFALWVERQAVGEQTARVRRQAEAWGDGAQGGGTREAAVVRWRAYRDKRRELEQTVACDTSYWVLLWRGERGCWEVGK